jgi:hypothetical protein
MFELKLLQSEIKTNARSFLRNFYLRTQVRGMSSLRFETVPGGAHLPTSCKIGEFFIRRSHRVTGELALHSSLAPRLRPSPRQPSCRSASFLCRSAWSRS